MLLRSQHWVFSLVLAFYGLVLLLQCSNIRVQAQFGVPRHAKTVGIDAATGGIEDVEDDDYDIVQEILNSRQGHDEDVGYGDTPTLDEEVVKTKKRNAASNTNANKDKNKDKDKNKGGKKKPLDPILDSSSSSEGPRTEKAKVDMHVLEKIHLDAPDLPMQLATDLAAVIYSAQTKNENQNDSVFMEKAQEAAQLFSNTMDSEQIVTELVRALEGLKSVDTIFDNRNVPHTAIVAEMKAQGMIASAEQEQAFLDDPALLKTEIRKTAYLAFCALAIAGEYLKL